MPLGNRSLTNEGLVYLVRCWAIKHCCRVGNSLTNKALLRPGVPGEAEQISALHRLQFTRAFAVQRAAYRRGTGLFAWFRLHGLQSL